MTVLNIISKKTGLHQVSLTVEQKNRIVYNPQTIYDDKNIEIMEGVYEAENYKINAFVKLNGTLPQRIIQEKPEHKRDNF